MGESSGHGCDSPGETHSPRLGAAAQVPSVPLTFCAFDKPRLPPLPRGSRGLPGYTSFLQNLEAAGAQSLFTLTDKGTAVLDSWT